MELSKLIVPSKTVWVEYPGLSGFEIELSYLTRDELMKIRDKSTTKNFGRRNRKVEDEVDNDVFQSEYFRAVIKNWRGLKYEYLPKLIPVDLSEVENLEDELEYSEKNAEALMKNCSDFDGFVGSILEEVSNFTKSS